MNFHIDDESIDAETHVIELGGEVDLYTAPEFKERLVQVIEDGKKHLVVESVVASQAQKHLRHPVSLPYRRVAHMPLDQPSASLFRRDGSPIPPCYDDRVLPHRASEGELPGG